MYIYTCIHIYIYTYMYIYTHCNTMLTNCNTLQPSNLGSKPHDATKISASECL